METKLLDKEKNQLDSKKRRTGYWEVAGMFGCDRYTVGEPVNSKGFFEADRRVGTWDFLTRDNSMVYQITYNNKEESLFINYYNQDETLRRQSVYIR